MHHEVKADPCYFNTLHPESEHATCGWRARMCCVISYKSRKLSKHVTLGAVIFCLVWQTQDYKLLQANCQAVEPQGFDSVRRIRHWKQISIPRGDWLGPQPKDRKQLHQHTYGVNIPGKCQIPCIEVYLLRQGTFGKGQIHSRIQRAFLSKLAALKPKSTKPSGL